MTFLCARCLNQLFVFKPGFATVPMDHPSKSDDWWIAKEAEAHTASTSGGLEYVGTISSVERLCLRSLSTRQLENEEHPDFLCIQDSGTQPSGALWCPQTLNMFHPRAVRDCLPFSSWVCHSSSDWAGRAQWALSCVLWPGREGLDLTNWPYSFSPTRACNVYIYIYTVQ